jgi:hypothetical protein
LPNRQEIEAHLIEVQPERSAAQPERGAAEQIVQRLAQRLRDLGLDPDEG